MTNLNNLASIAKHEIERILEALRHDIHHELHMAQLEPEYKNVHLYNARLNTQILELLNPKSPH